MATGPQSMAQRYGAQKKAAAKKKTQTAADHHVNVEVPQQLTDYYNKYAAANGLPDANGQGGGPPVDPALMAQQNSANLNIGLGGVWDTYKAGQINSQYGNLDNPAADAASNPFSQAALAYKRYNESKAGSLNSYAGQGQLYSGALQNAQEANAGSYAQSLDALRKSKQGAVDEITKGTMDRYSQVGADIGTDKLQSLLKALGIG